MNGGEQVAEFDQLKGSALGFRVSIPNRDLIGFIGSGGCCPRVCSWSADQLLGGHADVPGYLAQQNRRNIPAGVIRDRSCATIGVPVLHVRSSLMSQRETQRLENTADLARFQDRQFAHGLSYLDGLGSNKLGLQRGLPVLKQHGNHLFQVPF